MYHILEPFQNRTPESPKMQFCKPIVNFLNPYVVYFLTLSRILNRYTQQSPILNHVNLTVLLLK